MAAQASPVRINATLLAQAQAAGETFSRKIPEQITHWATLGRLVESKLNAAEISALFSGVAEVQVIIGARSAGARQLSVDIVDLAMQHQGSEGSQRARSAVTESTSKSGAPVRYQACASRPGYLERIAADGKVDIGTFKNGKFRKAAAVAVGL